MIRRSDVRKAFDILRSDGVVPLLRKVPHHFHWRSVKALEPAFKWKFERKYGPGIDITEKNWDNLILLDACRYDYFETYTSFEGELSRVVSKGRGSWEFIRDNFAGRELHDTVYVTANPHAERLEQDVFFTVKTVLDKWDPDTGTVPPECVTEAAAEAQEQYPNKRLIIHYMQPHTPHLGETARNLETEYRQNKHLRFREGSSTEGRDKEIKIFDLYRDNQITRSELRESYRETLQIVEPHVDDLISELNGKTVISADHGENLGESKYGMTLTGHGPNSKEVRFVPWMELPYEERKTVEEDPPIGFQCLEEEYVEDRLADLGYM
jgi:hypothetical protein